MLFTSITLPNQVTLKNRIVKAAMSETLAKSDNQPTQEHVELYRQWALGGAGMLISGNVMVSRHHRSEPGNVVVDDLTDKEMLRSMAMAGKTNDTSFILQLNHPGKQAPKTMVKEPLAPSVTPLSKELQALFNMPKEMSITDIEEVVNQFVAAAKIAEETGFSGVQIHAAHGYLLNQFLSPADNQRTDQYGGSLENRMRIIVEIYQNIRQATSPHFIVGLKINSSDLNESGFSQEDSKAVIIKMAELGIDFVEVSGGNYAKSKMAEVSDKGAFFLDFAKEVQALVKTPIILTGGLRQAEDMAEVVEQHGIAMVGIGKAFVLNPNFINDIQAGKAREVKLPRLSTRIKSLDQKIGSMIGLTYYEQGMMRLGRGKAPKYSTNAWPPLLYTIWRHGLHSLKPRRR